MKNKSKMTENNLTKADVEKAFKELEAEGKIAWNDEWRKNRNGKLEKVYVAVEFIKKN